MNYNSIVSTFLDDLNHPLRSEIELLRKCILTSSKHVTENIKWNGPNYCVNGEDRITMYVQSPKQIQLIFHRGAKKLEQPEKKLIKDKSGLLVWKENDRAIATFKKLEEIEMHQKSLSDAVNSWMKATT